jgi:hypothetical protein
MFITNYWMPLMHKFRVSRILAALASSVVLISCRALAPVAYQLEPVPAVIGCTAPCAGPQLEVTYLGVAGFLIRHPGGSLLTAPMFSNPSFDSVTPLRFNLFRTKAPPIVPQPALIERLLPAAADSSSMILVGHGHYDHLLDVPYIAVNRAKGAKIYGGPSIRHMLMGDPHLRADSLRLVSIDTSAAGTIDRRGAWIYSHDSAFRVMPLSAEHAPTVRLFGWGKLFASGTVDENLDSLPRRALDWKLGEPYAFIIDVLTRGDTAPAFRIYFQDAPSAPPLAFPPRTLGGRGFDLAILCVATARNVSPASPDSLLKVLRPSYVIAAHWESFFRPQTAPLMVNPTSDVDAFMNSLVHNLPKTSSWTMPLPRTTLKFAMRR